MKHTLRIRGRRRALGTALAVLASSAALTAVTEAPARAVTGHETTPQVVFTEHKDVDGVRTSTLVAVNPDGTGRSELVPSGHGLPEAEITGVSYSPDGLRMAFISNDGLADIWVADAGGYNARPVRMDIDEPDGWLDDLDWTPDGKQLYLGFRAKPGHDRLRVMRVNLDGSGLGYVFAAPERTWDSQVDVAWDGRVTFLRGGTVHIWDPRTGEAPKPFAQGLHPTFSPDGRRIAFAQSVGGSYDVHVGELGSGADKTVTHDQDVLFPQWSPVGTQVAFLSGGTRQQAAVTDADAGTGTRILSAPGTTASDIAWIVPRGRSPHGTFRHDFTGDGVPDVLALGADGVLWRYDGDGAGGLEPGVKIGWGWKGYRLTVAGDHTNDGVPDVLAQDASGTLWQAEGDGTGGLRQKQDIGWGWKDLTLTGLGDFGSGDRPADGYSDLLALDPKGELWLYGGYGRRDFDSRVNYGFGYQGYRLTGVGGFAAGGDQAYLGQHPSGDLYRYDNTVGRTKIGWGWKGLTLTGVGDLTGDGVPDVLARDAAGDLYRYDGDGTGGLKSRVKIGWGWNGLTAF